MGLVTGSTDYRVDLALVDARIETKLARFRAELAAERARAQTKRAVRWMVAINATTFLLVGGIAFWFGLQT